MATLPTGVEIRGNRICVWFMYKGKRCREVLKGWIVSPSNIKKAGNLRAVITSEISMGEFDYGRRFPSSKKAVAINTTLQVSTFHELCELWLKIKETEISANTLKKTKSQIDTIIKIMNGNTMLTAIGYSDILNCRNELLTGETFYSKNKRKNKKGRTVSTVNNYVSLLCSILNFAYMSGFIQHKPFESVKSLRKTRVKPDPLTREEFAALMASERGQSQNMWKFAVYSGVRHGELAALAWEDVDLDKGVIHVCRNLTANGMFGPPKTAAGNRTIQLLGPALDALKAQHELTAGHPVSTITFHHREYGSSEEQNLRFVFMPRRRKGEQKPCYSHSSIGSRWEAAVKRAGIRRRNPYHTRHTFACWLLTAGANPSFIANQMGHENAQMVYDVYSTWIEEMNGDQVSMLNSRLGL
ncbi:putative transposase/integrase [Klebsiella pneumoniae]|uniref:tyrosine-type recombinase/integrase n=1 Tax=Klebsiella pneumoniae TaxID=573 RepID=UPI000E2DB524|nr:site-specific integrase [Klebsiella pneumoniae]SWQ88307.1 putative transposase/integrase [Klebsiella pneumoniae]VUH58815.1 putative transposase/integrase [Klebsiella pneumoniae]HCK7137770.1 site-specific integrase [Klebsiella pneumoniae]